MLTFRDTRKVFDGKGDLLKMITNKNYNVDLASLADKKLLYDFAKEMKTDKRVQGRKSTRDRTLINLFKSQGLMVSASGNSNTIPLLSDPDELCDRLKLLLQEKHAGNKPGLINEENVVILKRKVIINTHIKVCIYIINTQINLRMFVSLHLKGLN